MDYETQAFSLRLPDGSQGVAISNLIPLAGEEGELVVDAAEDSSIRKKKRNLVADGEWIWLHLVPFGRWKGHPNGPLDFTRAAMENIVKLFDRRVNPLKVDYDHGSLLASPEPKPAAGYLHAFKIVGDGWTRGDGLWGYVELVARGAALIRSGEYRYNSPVIAPKSKDRKTGKPTGMEMVQASLTSDPFLDGQMAAQLTRMNMTDENKTPKDEPKTPEQLQLEATKPGDVTPLAEEDAADATSVLTKLAELMEVDPAAVVASMMEKLEEVAALLGAAQEEEGTPAEEEAPASATKPDKAAASRLDEIKNEQIAALSERLKVLEGAAATTTEKDIAATVDQAIEDGYVLMDAKSRDNAIWVMTNAPEKFGEIYGNKVVPLGRRQVEIEAPDGSKTGSTLTDAEQLAVDNLMSTGKYDEPESVKRVLARRN